MAMVASVCSAAIKSYILANDKYAQDNASMQTLCDGIAQAVVALVETATVTVPALGLISPGGLTPAPVTGVAVGTAS